MASQGRTGNGAAIRVPRGDLPPEAWPLLQGPGRRAIPPSSFSTNTS